MSSVRRSGVCGQRPLGGIPLKANDWLPLSGVSCLAMSVPAGRSGYEPPRAPDTRADLPGFDGDGNWRQRRVAYTALGLLIAGALVGLLVWHSTQAAHPVTRVRYVNDTRTRLVVTACGAATRCIVEAGASVVRTPPTKGDAWRVLDARTRQSAGCIQNTGEATVRLSDTRYGGTC